MACRSCSARLGQLPRRIAAPLQHSSLDSVPLRTRRLLATAPRALHTSSPRQGFDLKSLVGRRVADYLPAQRTYYIYQATDRMQKACADKADYTIDAARRKAGELETTAEGEEIGVSNGGAWHKDLGLLPTFSTWAHVTMLHMYLLVVRFRCLDATEHEAWQAPLVDHFFHQAEAKMEVAHALTSRAVRQRYLKDLFVQWRGLMLAYDEGLVKGDAVLASAVWRNLFKARDDVDARALAAVVAWMRAVLQELSEMPDHRVELRGETAFRWPVSGELRSVDVPTASMRVAFEQAGLTGQGPSS